MNTHNDASKAPATGKVFALGLDTCCPHFAQIQISKACKFVDLPASPVSLANRRA